MEEKQQYELRRIKENCSDRYALGNPLVLIGRTQENDIIIDERAMPDVAAQIELRNGDFIISSVKSSTLLVNGKKKKSAVLKVGDRIDLASESFLFDAVAATITPQEKASHEILESIHRFVEFIGHERDLTVLLRKILDILFDLMGGTDAFIFTINGHGEPEVFVSSCGESDQGRFSDTIIQEVLKRGPGIVLANALSTHEFSGAQSIADLQLMSVMCCPIMVAGKNIGIIYLGSKKLSESFSEDDLRTLNLYATVAGMLINHVDYIVHQKNAIKQLTRYQEHEGIVVESKVMQDILNRIESIVQSDIIVLLEGETGTGKDVLAHYIHSKSSRKDKPMVVVNCSSLRGELLESELFGHKKGSFTGATADHEGLFCAADGGCLFLDEIGEMSENLQAKLLRVLETGKIRPVGATVEKKVDVRVICATNRNLAKMVEEGTFRKDLYYRINQFSFCLPPLREREGDGVLLAYYFLEKFKSEYPSKDIVDFHPDSLRYISTYDWPGNVRELATAVHRAVLSSAGPFVTIDVGEKITKDFNFELATKNFQRRLINTALQAAGNNKEQAAKLLGMTRSTFFRYLASIKS